MSEAFSELVAGATPAQLRDALLPIATARVREQVQALRPALASVVERGGDPMAWRLMIIVIGLMRHARLVRRRAEEKRADLAKGSGAALWRIKLLDAEHDAYMALAERTLARKHRHDKALAAWPDARPRWRVVSATRIALEGPLPKVELASPTDDLWAECEATEPAEMKRLKQGEAV